MDIINRRRMLLIKDRLNMQGHMTVEKAFIYKGHGCLVVAQKIGHRCGYVYIPKEHQLHGKDYDNLPIDAHGGLTFAGTLGPENPDWWWIGFDCAHLGDSRDPSIMDKEHRDYYDSTRYLYPPSIYESIKDTDYVAEECRKIVRQLQKQYPLAPGGMATVESYVVE